MASEKTPRTLSEIGLTARALATIDGRHKKRGDPLAAPSVQIATRGNGLQYKFNDFSYTTETIIFPMVA